MLDVCKVKSNVRVLLTAHLGAGAGWRVKGCVSRDQSCCKHARCMLPGLSVTLDMAMANHTALTVMNTHAILTRIKTVAKLKY